MNIAVIAPTKFDFQDLACVELGLRWADEGAPTLRAEPLNGEDAELTWEENGRRRLCEVQVKGRTTGDLDMATLAEYLAHFPDHQANGCLLERLLANPEQVVLFVASERCRDDVASYRVAETWVGAYRSDDPNRRAGAALATALDHLSQGPARARTRTPSRLELARAAQVEVLSKMDVGRLAEALNRVFIHEEETTATIGVRLQRKLLDVGVASDRLFDGVGRLKQVVADDRVARRDIFADLRRVLADFAPEQMAQPKYLLRGNEDALAADLARNGAILLSGPPRVGKSWLALQLAGGLQRQGFEVARSSHIDQADRFLNDPVRKPRAYVLEDPLGERQAVRDVSLRMADLRRLVTDLPRDRRLIVAQSEAPVLQHFRRDSLRDCAIGPIAWHRLDPMSLDQAEALWRRDAADAGVVGAEIDRIAEMIRERADLRDAGALAYLAITFDRLRAGASANEVVAQARGDAVDFAQALADETPAVGVLLRGVAVTTETATGVEDADLAFVTSDSTERPSLDTSNGILVFGRRVPSVAPAYSVAPQLGRGAIGAADTLRRRRVLDSHDKRLNFVHPYLRAGAQAIFRPDLEEDLEAALALTARALAAVDPKVSLCAARNLDWIATALATREGGLLRAVDLAETGLRSLYPATRDACFEFLTARAGDLPAEIQSHLRRWVGAVDIELDDIEEVGGRLIVSSMASFYGHGAIPLVRIQPYVDAIEADQPVDLDPILALAILLAYRQNDVDLSPKLVDRLLSMDAAVLRAAACSDWLSAPRDEDTSILRRIESDPAPAVSNAVLDAVVRAWSDISEVRREALMLILEAHAVSPGSATRLLERLALFNRVEEFGEHPPWRVFSRLAPVALRYAPEVIFSNGRIWSAIQDAIRAGEGERLIPLLNVWTAHVGGRLVNRLPDEFELSVPDAMLDLGAPAWRWPLIQSLLDMPNTGARLRIVATLIDRWNDLADFEQKDLLRRLVSDDGDAVWLRAAALTRRACPAAVQEALAGRADVLDHEPVEFLAALGEPLYQACLHVFSGAPQPLWWLGSHHASAPAWEAASRWSAGGADRPGFEVALADQIAFTEDDDWLTGLVDQYAEADLPAVFRVFLRRKAEENGNWRKRAWNRLLDRGVAAGLIEGWIAEISAVAPVFLDHLRDVRLWLGEGDHEDRLIESLASDLQSYQTLGMVLEMVRFLKGMDPEIAKESGYGAQSSEDMVVTLLAGLRLALEQAPPRLFETWDHVRDELRKVDAPSELMTWVDAQRMATLDDRQAARLGGMGTEDQSALVGWVGPR
ncbi:MAG: hypothetical protein KA105_07330 [Caulobacter sp.]|nr:hypothetical protein [Caulobacter sp.]